MPVLTRRKTLVLDQASAERIERLEALWQVSQSEALRRALALAEAAMRASETQQPVNPVAPDLPASSASVDPTAT